MRSERGWTGPEVVVLLSVIAAAACLLYGLATFREPGVRIGGHPVCSNNLRQIGALRCMMEAGSGFQRLDGAAFLLKVVDCLHDDDLRVFLCPAEPSPDPARPERGTPEFVDLYGRCCRGTGRTGGCAPTPGRTSRTTLAARGTGRGSGPATFLPAPRR